jgi:hypothetical protein
MTKKNLNPEAIVNELKGQSAFFRAAEKQSPPPQKVKEKKDKPVDRSVDQSTDQQISQSTDQLIDIDTLGPIVARPRAFYITQKLDRWLDEAVRQLKEKGIHKADRSVVVNALLHNPALFTSKALDDMRKRLLAHLTNKSLRRGQSTE